MEKVKRGLCTVVLFLLVSCGPSAIPTPAASSTPMPGKTPLPSATAVPEGRLVLAVSNQSYDLKLVDIRVQLDGQELFCQDFYVGNQHNWEIAEVYVEPGEHHLQAVSLQGEVTFSRTVTIIGDRYASLDFWSGDDPAATGPGRFSFIMVEEPFDLFAFWEGPMHKYYRASGE